jgi:hypothetical protein
MQVPRLVPARLLKLELARVAANTSRLMGRRVVTPHVDARQLSGGEAHAAALLSWVQASHACSLKATLLVLSTANLLAGVDHCIVQCLKVIHSFMQAVCCLYNVQVTDFSTSFADGRVLCLLVRSLGHLMSFAAMTRCTGSRHCHAIQMSSAVKAAMCPQVNYYAPSKLSVSDIYAPGGYPDADAAALSAHELGAGPAGTGSTQGRSCPP